MKKVLINSSLALLFSIATFFAMISLMVLNDNFIINEVKKSNYYREVYDVLEKRLDTDYKKYGCFIDEGVLKDDINRYIKKNFDIKKIEHDIECNESVSNRELNIIYRDVIEIKLLKNKNIILYKYIVYGITLFIILIVGTIFIKTKKYHDIYLIMIISFIFLVGIFGGVYLFVEFNTDIINQVINSANHYLLAFAVILLEIGILKKLKIKI